MSVSYGNPVKAYIYNEDKGQKVIDCLFNPTEYSFSKSNEWSEDKASGQDLPIAHFQGGGATSMSVTILFDTYAMDNGDGPPKDVREYTEKIFALMKVDSSLKDSKTGKSRPPIISFRWGRTWSFKSVIKSISQKFTLFTSVGTPVRATLQWGLQQIQQDGTYPPQNPTSVADVERVHVVGPGETIDGIAFTVYGDAMRWRQIAEYNNLDNPLRLQPGQKLAIPNKNP